MIVVTISLALMIVITIIGNILVCLSVVLVKKLRHPSNYLLVSLAISGNFSCNFSFSSARIVLGLMKERCNCCKERIE